MEFFYEPNQLVHRNNQSLPEERKVGRLKRKAFEAPGTVSTSAPTYADNGGRKRVATVEDIEFAPTKKPVRSKSNIGYLKNAKKVKKDKMTFEQLFFRVAWGLFFILLVRLVTMNRGLFDFYQMNKKLQYMTYQLEQAKTENAQLEEEIKLIQVSKTYQKKLARDHLGVIGNDEYFVLFAQESKDQSI